ncbi:winged helix-turn-helix transcriptional regulator [Candidatus Bathyarchaeota archaeon]|nr:winged helix-turn-helix transcriptional regulator [Candidatus Bathyarchaeota archaeon]
MELSTLVSLRKASTQRRVLFYLISSEKNLTPDEIAKELGLSINAINLALFHLHKKGLIKRPSRGIYSYKLGPLLVPLLREYLMVRKRRR